MGRATISEVTMRYMGGLAVIKPSGERLLATLCESRKRQSQNRPASASAGTKHAWSPSPCLFIGQLSPTAVKHSNPASINSSATTLVSANSIADMVPKPPAVRSGSCDRWSQASRASSVSQLCPIAHACEPSGVPYQPVSTWATKAGDAEVGNIGQVAPINQELHRTSEEQEGGKERLNLNRQNLYTCLTLPNETRLRLLNYQNNFITKIEHLDHLVNLVFLDFYNNHLERISGLKSLQNLRVLMLGRNSIHKIEGLENLSKLDVLDLHSNQIELIENLGHLSELRVLNLEDNCIKDVSQLEGLRSIAEVNLKRNKISVVKDITELDSLRRLMLNHNEITSFDDISDVLRLPHLNDLAIDSNPICKDGFHRAFVINRIRSLKTLDGKRINDEERRAATKIARRESERRKESERMNLQREERERVIAYIQRNWSIEVRLEQRSVNDANDRKSRPQPPDVPWLASRSSLSKPISRASSAARTRSSKALLVEEVKIFNGENGYIELTNGRLAIYGDAINMIDKIDPSSVHTVRFTYVSFPKIAHFLLKLRRFTNLHTVAFSNNNLTRLKQINHLALLPEVSHLDFMADENPAVTLPFFRYYVLSRLCHLSIKKICNEVVTIEELEDANGHFGALQRTVGQLSSYTLSRTPESVLPFVLNMGLDTREYDERCCHELLSQSRITAHNRLSHWKSFAKKFTQTTLAKSVRSHARIQEFDYIWPHLVQEACLNGLRA
ncbi:uncharacterized protein SPPG_01156 [Spizellomyces punctatus DAOM BR117]|uniref:Leucine-rich repeat-containing protein 49 n=1 Tax=Spizellomyces punctatus (strain DAOM BR117) TaxID=645134 RepID=A0A0L0HS61_SPIPD|nr:uncharacterized protein SPPG_01156 [Spizellomyces punctatus DAOM BR117]KND03689.1 hypothetical protein SPPG_01156 [Spizellomyces punctatus DAOM BR117]|eukprot:XP_016611728.1 hypothetical protein SPPG_01156 [Spizellomyces punctatus DAOM BR117]